MANTPLIPRFHIVPEALERILYPGVIDPNNGQTSEGGAEHMTVMKVVMMITTVVLEVAAKAEFSVCGRR